MSQSSAARRSGRLLLFVLVAVGTPAHAVDFRLTFDPAISRQPFTGRVFVVLLKKQPGARVPDLPDWFDPDPMFAVDVKGWEAGKPLTIGEGALAYPQPLSKVAKREYFVLGLMDFGNTRSFTAAPGNGWCTARPITIDPSSKQTIDLHLDKVVEGRKFRETDRIKLVDIESKLLSDFHHRPVHLRAGVVLPASWREGGSRKYPAVYEIPGFGGSHLMAPFRSSFSDVAGVEMLWVMLDPDCPLGHSVFADSANNGPWGQALIHELIPYIEKKYSAIGTPAGRFVTGHSSGGWSSLWLQVTYPDFFGGVWSTAPDPVDFRDFQRIDLTKPGQNMFQDENGKPRPVARDHGTPILFYKPFSDLEEVMGHGGQLGSFEAVFGPAGADGKPKHLWNRQTGAVDPAVARAWEAYDISRILKDNWKTLGPKLAGKIHVYCGGDDTFFLDSSTRLLGARLKELGSDAVVEIVPGKTHGSLLDPTMRKRIAREMAEQWQRVAR